MALNVLKLARSRRAGPTPARGATPTARFTDSLATTPAGSLLAGPREIPVSIVAALVAPETTTERKLELVEAMGTAASDRGVLAEHYLPWYVAIREAVGLLADDPAVDPEALGALRWKIVECAARVGLAADVRLYAGAAVTLAPITPVLLNAMLEWRVGSRGAVLALMELLNAVTADGVDKARRHFSNFLRDFTHA